MDIRMIIAAAAATMLAGCSSLKDGEYNLALVTTGDGHGSWFSKPFSDKGSARGSLMAQSLYVNDIRAERGEDNVILVDAGDNFLGSNATFYYNYVDTLSPYLYPRLAAYMKYDAVVAGHCDFEAGHGVYDRAADAFRKERIPFLAGNAVRTDNGKSYFRTGTVVKKNGIKVAILGYTNADNAALMDRSAYAGLDSSRSCRLSRRTWTISVRSIILRWSWWLRIRPSERARETMPGSRGWTCSEA